MIVAQYIVCVFVLICTWNSCNCDDPGDLDRGFRSNEDKLNSLSKKVLKHYERHMTSDVESIRTSNWLLERFLQEYYYNERTAERAVIEAFDYYHKEELHKIDYTFFPSEMYGGGNLFRFGTSTNGQPLIGISVKHLKAMNAPILKSGLPQLIEKFCLYLVYRTMFEAKEKNFIMYSIFTNTSIDVPANSYFKGQMNAKDSQLKNFMAIIKHFPGIPLKHYIVGMSEVQEMQVRMAMLLLKPSLKERIVFVDSLEQIKDVIPLTEVPVHAGGLNKNFVRIPPGVRSGKCLRHLSYITNKEWDIFRAINTELFEEGMKAEAIDSMDQYLRSCDKLKSKM